MVVSASDYNGIKLPALVTAPLLSRKKMQGWNVERSPLRHYVNEQNGMAKEE